MHKNQYLNLTLTLGICREENCTAAAAGTHLARPAPPR